MTAVVTNAPWRHCNNLRYKIRWNGCFGVGHQASPGHERAPRHWKGTILLRQFRCLGALVVVLAIPFIASPRRVMPSVLAVLAMSPIFRQTWDHRPLDG
jgi:hypothetical protein